MKMINLVIKPVDNYCNLSCEYCLTKRSLEDNNCTRGEDFLRWFEILVEKLNSLTNVEKVRFTWHGGEPLLFGVENYRKVIGLQKKLKLDFDNVIQTNGLLLTPQLANTFVSDLKFSISISIDGPDFESNSYRFQSENEFLTTKSNLDSLSINNISYSLIFVIHDRNFNEADKIFNFITDQKPTNGVALPGYYLDEHNR
ncbi:MAG: radical SAM protein, partial [Oligoflexia bacterium]|nr:radical SAM protein [Oligoflexia bacterium]